MNIILSNLRDLYESFMSAGNWTLRDVFMPLAIYVVFKSIIRISSYQVAYKRYKSPSTVEDQANFYRVSLLWLHAASLVAYQLLY